MKEHCDACTSSMPRLWRSDGSDCACTKIPVISKCAQQVQFTVALQYSICLVCVPFLCMVASAFAHELKMRTAGSVCCSLMRCLRACIYGNAVLHIFASFSKAAHFALHNVHVRWHLLI